MERVAVVGLGAMGSRIAMRLLDTEREVIVWNRTSDRLAPLKARGARAASSPRDAAARSETLITMLANPPALRAVSEGPDGIAAGAHPGLVVIEMSTVGAPAVRRLASLLGADVRLVDAPVLGSIGEAESGALTILAGGCPEALDEVAPLLASLGTVIRVGPLGTGAAAKLVANAALLGTLTALGETLALADALGLPRETAVTVLASTPLAEQAARRLPSIETGAFPRRFALSLARKDADLILEAGAAAPVQTPALEAAQRWLLAAEADGRGDDDYTAVLATMLEKRKRYDGLIVDLDGVVWLSGDPIDGVVETLERLRAQGVRVLFLTNNPQHGAATQARRLSEIGIAATADDVLTVSAATGSYFTTHGLAATRTYVIGPPALHEELAAAGVPLLLAEDAASAEIVVVAGHSGFDYTELRAAIKAIDTGAALFAIGRDRFVPTREGREPATGAILAAIETATGALATIVGKPAPHMFTIARQRLAGCTHVAVVGDNLEADIAGAKQAGLDAILVLSGATSADEIEGAEAHPDFVLPSLADLG